MKDIFHDRFPERNGSGDDDPIEDVNVDLINLMDDKMQSQLSLRTLAMTTKLRARVKVLSEMAGDAGESPTKMQMFMAAVTERLALFEMLINSLANKAESDSKK